jgi:hypothetical protein
VITYTPSLERSTWLAWVLCRGRARVASLIYSYSTFFGASRCPPQNVIRYASNTHRNPDLRARRDAGGGRRRSGACRGMLVAARSATSYRLRDRTAWKRLDCVLPNQFEQSAPTHRERHSKNCNLPN